MPYEGTHSVVNSGDISITVNLSTFDAVVLAIDDFDGREDDLPRSAWSE